MALFQLDQVFTYQDANEIKKLWASDTEPTAPETGEIWLDISTTPIQLKRYNGTDWDIISDIVSPLLIKTGATVNSEIQLERAEGAKFSAGAGQALTWIGSDTPHELRFQVNRDWVARINNSGEIEVNGSRFFISLAGNVGIGTLTPSAKLDVSGGVKIQGGTAWHSLNDGPDSGLDADTLDSQEGSFYQNASNLNTGTVPLARIPTTLTGKDADKLDGQHGIYYNDAENLTGSISRSCLNNSSNKTNPFTQSNQVTADNQQTIIFPQAFSSVPNVVCSVHKSGLRPTCHPYGISSTGFGVFVKDESGNPVTGATLNYIAHGSKN